MLMVTWVLMFISSLLVPLTMLGFGYWFSVKPPQYINFAFGYRTKRSMKSQEAWDFAQYVMSKLWTKYGMIMLAVTVLIYILLLWQTEDVVYWATLAVSLGQIAALILTIFPVESALKRNFDEHGNLKK